MRLIETLKNIWKVEELRQRILTTLFFVLIYRLGSYIVIPGIDPNQLSALHKQTSEGLMALLDMFSGGAFSNASIFAMGIMPYISASIVMQLAAIAVPSIQKLQQEGESGRRQDRPVDTLSNRRPAARPGFGLSGQPEHAAAPSRGLTARRTVVRYLCDRRHGCRQYVRPLAW